MMSTGQWVQQVTLGWLLYDLTGNSMLLGALNGLRALPFLVTGPMAGVAADRMDRRKLLLSTQWVLIATAILFGALVMSPFFDIWHIFVFTLITGVAWTITEPVFKCEACDSGSLEILSGRELDIESIEIAEEGHNDSG